MATYVTKRCPHCGHAYQFFQSGDQRKYGCPYLKCEQCNKSFWDNDIKEPALYGYENFHETMKEAKKGCAIFIYCSMAILFLMGGIFLVTTGEMLGIGLFVIAGIDVWIVVSAIKEAHYQEKNRDGIIAALQRDYDASLSRLKNTNYLTSLAGFDPLARELLKERLSDSEEHYAERPQQPEFNKESIECESKTDKTTGNDFASSNTKTKNETTYLMEDRNGMLVSVPESKLESWVEAQENGKSSINAPLVKEKSLEEANQMTYGDSNPPKNKKAISNYIIILVALVVFIISVVLFVPAFLKYSFAEEEIQLVIDESAKITIYNPYFSTKFHPYLETEDSDIISITDYKITALNAGTATVKLMSNGKVHDECSIKVEHIKPKNIFFIVSEENVYVNESIDIKMGYSPQNVTDKELSYKISDKSIAKIEGSRLIGLKLGSVKVTVTHKSTGLSCSKIYNVIPSKPESINIHADSEVNIGEAFKPGVSFSPQNITDKSYTLSSSDPSVLYVNNNTVTAKKVGTAILTVKHSSGISSSITIKVKPIAPSSVNLIVSGTTNMIINTSTAISSEVLPLNTTDKTIKWSSSDNSVAEVDQNGVVLAKSPGKVRITATLHNGVSDHIDFIVNTTPVNQKDGFIKSPSYECEAPVTIHAPKSESCYVYFKSATDPNKDFSIFASAKSTVEVDAPLGKYKLYYATGKAWYGTEYRFGIGTEYYTSNEEFNFYAIGNYVYGTELTLYAVAYGNLDTYEISENEFPE